ncbi:hypothetical protein EII17_03685 [Clostridiales bacterium COT073_COT-073]|nr:hypothetical protein EII17_03685 [Clostridiales bacterium COT073_COT-073]
MKKLLALALCVVIFGGTVYATATMENVQATLQKEVKVELNGKKLELKTTEKKSLYPISFENHIYLPIDAVADDLNLDVKWDEKTKIVKLDTKKPSVSAPAAPTQQQGKIKGNKKSKIYHLPNNVSYDKIKEENVVYFNTEEEAVKAGYRKAKK